MLYPALNMQNMQSLCTNISKRVEGKKEPDVKNNSGVFPSLTGCWSEPGVRVFALHALESFTAPLSYLCAADESKHR